MGHICHCAPFLPCSSRTRALDSPQALQLCTFSSLSLKCSPCPDFHEAPSPASSRALPKATFTGIPSLMPNTPPLVLPLLFIVPVECLCSLLGQRPPRDITCVFMNLCILEWTSRWGCPSSPLHEKKVKKCVSRSASYPEPISPPKGRQQGLIHLPLSRLGKEGLLPASSG